MHRGCTRLVPFAATPGLFSWGLEPVSSSASMICPRHNSSLAMLQDTFSDLDRQFGRMEREMNRVLKELPGCEASLGFEPQVVKEGDATKYRLNVHMGNSFSPENVKVSLKDRVMTIEGKAEEKSEDGTSRVYQEVSRQFLLPEDLDLKEMKSVLTPEGVLQIEAPLPQQALPEPPKPQAIPIHIEQ